MMDENTVVSEFYDYLRYSISVVQYSLPAIVVEDIKANLSNFISKMNLEELEGINKSLEMYDEYYLKSYNVVDEMKNSIENNPYSGEINKVFSKELGEISSRLERLEFIRNFIASVIDMIDQKCNTLNSGVKRV